MIRPSIIPNIQDWFDGREEARNTFLACYGWQDVTIRPVGEDCSFRRYFRLTRAQESIILMESVPDDAEMATPGHNISDYIRIGTYLRSAGLSTPEIYEADKSQGYLLLEDFGDISFRKALQDGEDQQEIYALAADVLLHLAAHAKPDDVNLPAYYTGHVHEGRRNLVDWYIPAVKQSRNPEGLVESYLGVWNEIEKTLPPVPMIFLHGDYHLDNLMWLQGREGLKRCGILDFQGAMKGPQPYDLANLLEDVRTDVSPDIRKSIMERYCIAMNADEKAAFEDWYRVLATQFHCRVLGQFIRLAVKDGKTRYLQHLPRVVSYLEQGLKHPVLYPLKQWFDAQGLDFGEAPEIRL